MENKNTEAAMVMAFGLLAHHCGANRGELIKDIQVLFKIQTQQNKCVKFCVIFLKRLGLTAQGRNGSVVLLKVAKKNPKTHASARYTTYYRPLQYFCKYPIFTQQHLLVCNEKNDVIPLTH